jgi:hypothetical protein
MIPEHYARDIALRCNSLIASLLPMVQHRLPVEPRFGGTFETTFLIAMGAPMILLPVERLFKAADHGVTDDRQIDPELAEAVADVLGEGKRFSDAPFAPKGAWSYIQRHEPFNVPGVWPRDLLDSLSGPAATESAGAAPARRIVTDLGNALAHGGVAYLDEQGRQNAGQAAMLALARAVMTGRHVTASTCYEFTRGTIAISCLPGPSGLPPHDSRKCSMSELRQPLKTQSGGKLGGKLHEWQAGWQAKNRGF